MAQHQKIRERVWTDASTLLNGRPGQQSWCAVVADDGTSRGLLLLEEDLGDVTVNAAEYMGVIRALEWAKASSIDVLVVSDSQTVVRQVSGDWACVNGGLQKYRDEVRCLLKDTGSLLKWQEREHNRAGWHWETVNRRRRREAVRERAAGNAVEPTEGLLLL